MNNGSWQTFIGATAFHFAAGKIEDTGVLDVGALGEVDPNVDMVGTIRMLLARAHPLRDRPLLLFADTLDMSEEILTRQQMTSSDDVSNDVSLPRERDSHTLCM